MREHYRTLTEHGPTETKDANVRSPEWALAEHARILREEADDPLPYGAIRDGPWTATLGLGRLRGQERRDDRPQLIADQWNAHAANLPHGLGSVRRT